MTVGKEPNALVEVIVAVDDEEEGCLAAHEVARIREWEESLRRDKTGWWLFAAGCCFVAAFLPLRERYNNRHNRNAAIASRFALAIAAVGVIAVTAVLVPAAVDRTMASAKGTSTSTTWLQASLGNASMLA